MRTWSYRPFRADEDWIERLWRIFLGPAILIDGIILTLTLARFSPCLHMEMSSILVKLKIRQHQRK